MSIIESLVSLLEFILMVEGHGAAVVRFYIVRLRFKCQPNSTFYVHKLD